MGKTITRSEQSFTILYISLSQKYSREFHFHNWCSSDHLRIFFSESFIECMSASDNYHTILIVSLTHSLIQYLQLSFCVLLFYIEKLVWFLFAYRCFSSEFVPYGNETGWLAVYSSRGPSVHDASATALTDRVQIGKPLLLEVSGYC